MGSKPMIIRKLALALAGALLMAAPAQACKTTMVTSAHVDDPILFMSPDILNDVHQGRCLRVIDLSAGSHSDMRYGLQRERAVEAAYANMAGLPSAWTYHVVNAAGHLIAEARLNGDSKISIDFLRLPNNAWPNPSIDPAGPAAGKPSDLEAIERHWMKRISAIDGTATYTRWGLVQTLLAFMKRFKPSRIDTQDFVHHYGFGDHSDHRATAFLTRAGWRLYHRGEIVSYLGYSSVHLAANVFGTAEQEKLAAWQAYAPIDGDVTIPIYGKWLQRQYRIREETA